MKKVLGHGCREVCTNMGASALGHALWNGHLVRGGEGERGRAPRGLARGRKYRKIDGKNRKSPGTSGSLWGPPGASGDLRKPPKTAEDPRKPSTKKPTNKNRRFLILDGPWARGAASGRPRPPRGPLDPRASGRRPPRPAAGLLPSPPTPARARGTKADDDDFEIRNWWLRGWRLSPCANSV